MGSISIPVAAIAAVGAVASAGSAIAGGIAQGQAASYQAAVAANNAQIAKQNQTSAGSAAAAKTEAAGLKASEQDSGLRAAIAANNLDVNTGSPADVEKSERLTGQLNTETVERDAALTTYGYGAQATGYEAQSSLDAAEAGYAPIAGAISGAGSLLSGEPNVGFANSWMSQRGLGATVADLFGGGGSQIQNDTSGYTGAGG